MSRSPTPLFAITLASIVLIGPLAVHLVLPVLPDLKSAFKISDGLTQLIFSVALFSMALSTPGYGLLSDRYGRRPVLLAGLGLFLLGSVIASIAETISTLIAGRLIQSVGAGCSATLVRTIARDAYGQDHLVKVIAYLTMFWTLGPMISPMIGGELSDVFGWRSVFAFASLAGGAIAMATYFVVHETRPSKEPGQNDIGIIQSYVSLFSNLRFVALVFQPGLSAGAFFAMATACSGIMKESLARSAAEFGVYFTLFPMGLLGGNLVSSRLGAQVSTGAMVLAGAIILAGAVMLQSCLLIFCPITPITLFLPGFFFTFAQGISLPNAQAGAMAVFPRLSGTAAGVSVCIQMLCSAAFAQLYGLIANGTIMPLVFAILLASLLSLIAGGMAFFLERREL
jgi:DHA1 family bicyclomycin/chloramphenicol resistance-like MFS transporter